MDKPQTTQTVADLKEEALFQLAKGDVRPAEVVDWLVGRTLLQAHAVCECQECSSAVEALSHG